MEKKLKQDEDYHSSAGKELRDAIIERAKKLWKWYIPHKEKSIAHKILLTILKTPVILLLLFFSPVAFIVLVFTFIVAF